MTTRPATENGGIEITPEMIKAGVSVLDYFDPAEACWELRCEIVSEIYEVMSWPKRDTQKVSSIPDNASPNECSFGAERI